VDDDILERLRMDQASWSDRSGIIWDDNEAAYYGEAADEIERLRARVAHLQALIDAWDAARWDDEAYGYGDAEDALSAAATPPREHDRD
jgi:hypothetical protein